MFIDVLLCMRCLLMCIGMLRLSSVTCCVLVGVFSLLTVVYCLNCCVVRCVLLFYDVYCSLYAA